MAMTAHNFWYDEVFERNKHSRVHNFKSLASSIRIVFRVYAKLTIYISTPSIDAAFDISYSSKWILIIL